MKEIYINHNSTHQKYVVDIYFLILYSSKNMITDFQARRREEGRKGEKHWCEKETLMWNRNINQLPLICPDQWPNLQPKHVPWLGNNPQPFGLWNNALTQWATLVRDIINIF